MRLTSAQRESIVDAFRKTFRSEARLLLFGSRTDDARRGGDIDLCVETNADRAWDALVDLRRSFQVELFRRLGDRRVDIVIRRHGDALRPIDREIGEKGIELCTLPS